MHRTASSTLRSRYSGLRTVRLLWVVLVTGCPGPDPPPPPPPEAATTLEIVPEWVSVVPNAEFVLRVRVRDQYGMLLPDAYGAPVVWAWNDPTGLTTPGTGAGSSIRVSATGEDDYIKLTATLPNGTSATATIIVAPDAPSASDPEIDWIVAPHNQDGTPMLALIDAQQGSDWRNDQLFAFVGSSALAFFLDPCNPLDGADCGRVTLFSRDWSVAHADINWVTGCDVVEVTEAVPDPDVLNLGPNASALAPSCQKHAMTFQKVGRIPAQVWTAAGGMTLASAKDAVLYARGILEQSPMGMILDPPVNQAPGQTAVTVQVDGSGRCDMDHPIDGVRTQLQKYASLPNTAFAPNQALIVYVEDLHVVGEWYSGYTCPSDPSYGTVILISKNGIWDTTLAHELGHALGPWPNWGHAELSGIAAEFDRGNLMWGAEVDNSSVNRRMLTLGQLYRIALAKDALVHGTATGIDCKTDLISGTPCPRLSKDHRP